LFKSVKASLSNGDNVTDLAVGAIKDNSVWILFLNEIMIDVPVGGISIPIDQSALLLAGASSVSMWMIPVVIAGIGIGVFVIKRRK